MTQLLTEESALTARLERHRRELHVHCYRMLGSFDAAEELTQETFLRAWRQRDRLDNGSWFRAWLYRIATNACLDALGVSSRRTTPLTSLTSLGELPGLQPYPDHLLDEIEPWDSEPLPVVTRETIELTYIAAIQLLPPRQRAALILRDVVGWSMRETAGLLDTTIVAANSALQRARVTLYAQLPAGRHDGPATGPGPHEWALLERYIEANARTDAAGDWRLVPTAANRQPAAASYVRAPGDCMYQAFELGVLRVEAGEIAEITTFDARLFPLFGLPTTR